MTRETSEGKGNKSRTAVLADRETDTEQEERIRIWRGYDGYEPVR